MLITQMLKRSVAIVDNHILLDIIIIDTALLFCGEGSFLKRLSRVTESLVERVLSVKFGCGRKGVFYLFNIKSPGLNKLYSYLENLK